MGCMGKTAYASPQLAWRTIHNVENRRTSKKRKGAFKPYKCRVCGMWHIGHTLHPDRRSYADL